MKYLTEWLNDFCEKTALGDELERLFRACFMNTYDTTLESADGETYIVTGDIPAMWLRDSTEQVAQYLPLAKESEEVRKMFSGLLSRQFRYIGIDPYANAFNKTANGHGHKDITKRCDWVWERKFEIDSLCYPLWLACKYYALTHDATPLGEQFIRTVETVLDTFETEQRHSEKSDYSFIRVGEYAQDTLPNGGKGDVIPYTGMIWSAFRPSDDRCVYNYFIPGNIFAVATLRKLSESDDSVLPADIKERCSTLARVIDDGIQKYGVVEHPKFGKIYAYETDGKGNYVFMDDGNAPSLMSLPYLGYCTADNPIYKNTRKFILSKENPFYFEGNAASGIGSPHTPDGYVWHIGLLIQGLTADTVEEKRQILHTILSTHAGTYYMHEGFDKDDPTKFTRPWFAWANSLLALFVMENRKIIPELLRPVK